MTGDLISLELAVERYAHLLPDDLYPDLQQAKKIKAFLSEASVYLIETQRLLELRDRRDGAPNARQAESATTRVSSYSADLARKLNDALAQNSSRSQELDRTFPERLLTGKSAPRISDQMIRDEYNRQAEFRSRLAAIDALGTSSEYLPLPERALQPWERRVLWTYLQDTERKLSTFKDILDRVTLLQQIVNSRFKYKSLSISRERGFVILTDEPGEEIPPYRLSSGEQHELVLTYDLLFRVDAGSLVLIDEPEISLHVGWQRQFLHDLFDIARLTSLRFVIATHSPQIIHKWWDRTISLVPKEEMDD
jgi:ABC-type ATPase involved in cell division